MHFACQSEDVDEWQQLRERLTAAGVGGTKDLGRFVSNPGVLGASQFDERSAMPHLIEALPTLNDSRLVGAVAGHLRGSWARPAAFDALLSAFERWAPSDPLTGWHLGDALGTTATKAQADTLNRCAQDRTYGEARQMVVHALSRFKTVPGAEHALVELIEDPDVALHAMHALRRVVGPERALPHLERVEREHAGTPTGETAAREVKKVRKTLA